MKTIVIISGILIMASVSLLGQVPQAFKYQAVIRDTTGSVFQNKLISLRVSILKGDAHGEAIYSEIHDVWTDQFGLVNLNIGQGLDVSRDFSTIPWGEDTFFIQVEMDMDGAMNYHFLGTSQLMAVPYALYAEGSGNDYWEKGANGIHYAEGNVGIGTDDPQNTLDVLGGANIRGNVTLGSGNWIGLYLNGFGNDDQPEWLIASHNQGGLQLRRWDGVDFSEHYLKVDEGRFRFGAYDSPPLMYQFHGWAYISDSLKVGGNNFFAGNDGKVGIGTTTPQARLHINSEDDTPLLSLAGFNPGIKFTDINNDSKTWQIKSDNHNQLQNFRILEDGEENKTRFYIAEGGKVGIGTTNPESILDVQGRNIELADYVFLGRMYSGTDLLLGHNIKAIDYENTRGAYVANDWPLGYSGIRMYNGTIQFHAKGGYVYEGELASNELMRIVSNGNVGIGTTNPQRKLHINDVMRLEPSFAPLENPSEGDIYMDGNDHVLKVYNGTEWKSCW